MAELVNQPETPKADEPNVEAAPPATSATADGEVKQEEVTSQKVPAETVPEEEANVHFEPVVQLDEVEVKTHEEEEDVIYKQRAKLFVFGETLLDKGTGNKSWKERGIGEAKLLRHRENQRIRLLLRQEKTMKVICNHVVDPRIVMTPNAGSDRSWVWSAYDFSEGDLVETIFAIRFGNSDNAAEFKGQFEECQRMMTTLLEGEDAAGAQQDSVANEATEALESLSVKKDESTEGGEKPEETA
mmetsp:Transcript_16647/g.22023  ORF Transcript_16647/g.22023 Transcript_16647/m.22023 type:complete len:243 (+) Transcript_16647:160-888(+)